MSAILRSGHAIACDAALQECIIFNGSASELQYLGDNWRLRLPASLSPLGESHRRCYSAAFRSNKDLEGCNQKWESLLERSKQKRHGFHGFHGFVKNISIMCWGRPLGRQIPLERQVPIKVMHKQSQVGEYRADFLVGGKIILEIKATAAVIAEHHAQALHYLAASGLRLALFLNFGTK